MNAWHRSLVALLLSLAAAGAIAQRTPQKQSFDLHVPWIPQPVQVDGKTSLVYELRVTNYAQEPLKLTQLTVLDAQDHVLAEWGKTALDQILGRPDHPADHDNALLPPGISAIAFLSTPIDSSTAAKGGIKHRILYATSSGQTFHVEGGTFAIDPPKPLQLGPPLRGGPWVAIYDARWERGHRRVLYATNGTVHIPGRFAIDWILVGDHGGYARGDGATPAQWFGYGAQVLAVADAVVASTGEGIPEARTLAEGAAHKVSLENAAGNYVALALGDGRYAFYEHLKPASITVKAGDHVRRGQVIGQLGFTGESTGPHLHFHVSDANAPLSAEGLPYALERFRVRGTYTSIEAFDQGKPWLPSTKTEADVRRGEFPAPLMVVDFGGDGYVE
ncbi:M23 family metallopeptidase [Dyella flagellata]|uniref:Peptidase M23 n=1 Tax=Dyella flagellata TaxID=1867833 RepID=A0ABQ5XB12_9GAMM|nr:M23 family metallopeptidase [Dyella flagellata]GLQ88805.1 peptidase M23 [Dyella flagellata]